MNLLLETENLSINLNKINIFYSYNGGGKTVFLKSLYECLQSSDFLINAQRYNKKTFPSTFIDESENLNLLNKLNSKNYLTKDLFNYINEDIFSIYKQNIKDIFDKISNVLNLIHQDDNIKYNLCIDDINEFIIKNTSVEFTPLYSNLRKIYFNKQINQNLFKIILIDSFDNGLNENEINSFLQPYMNKEFTLLLTTSNPQSLQFALNNFEDVNVFVIRKEKIYEYNNLINLFLDNGIENSNEYDIYSNYNYKKACYINTKNVLTQKCIFTLGRIFTNKYCKIDNNEKNNLTYSIIEYNNDFEYSLYNFLNNFLNNS